jgi:hypothetical protein
MSDLAGKLSPHYVRGFLLPVTTPGRRGKSEWRIDSSFDAQLQARRPEEVPTWTAGGMLLG